MRTANFGIATGAFVAERDDWPSAIGRAQREGWRSIELTAISEGLITQLLSYLEASEAPLPDFDRVSVHAPVVFDSSPSRVAAMSPLIAAYDLVFHPDVYHGVDELLELGSHVVFENMDLNKPFGRTVDDMSEVFGRFPLAGFCLDVAHVWTNDRSLRLGFELLDAFGSRLRQLHVSGIEPNGEHRPTTGDDLVLYRPLLDCCTHVPWLLESELVA